jgi:hypothetical protein
MVQFHCVDEQCLQKEIDGVSKSVGEICKLLSNKDSCNLPWKMNISVP